MAKIFVTRPIPEIGIKMLQVKKYNVVVNEKAEDRAATKEEIMQALQQAVDEGKPFDALLSVLTDKIDGDIMDAGLASPTRATPEASARREPGEGGPLKIIANYAVGFDNIDLEAAKQRNIMVTNTPGVLTNTVAEHTFALMLSIARRISEADRFSRAGKYHAWGPSLLLGTDLSGKTLGVVGLGRIGSRVAYHAVKGFDMKVLYTDEKRNEQFEIDFSAQGGSASGGEKEFKAVFVEKLDDLLPQCDFVSIHVPLLDPVKSPNGDHGAGSTHHLINESRLKLMRRSAYLINTSRGPIVDEKALAKALKEGWIKGAAIDVFEFEPEITPELKELDNIILTPHIASATEETRNKMAEMAAQNIIEALEGRVPPNLIK